MKRFTIILLGLCAMSICAGAQVSTWFCTKNGARLTYGKTDARDNNSGSQSYQYVISSCTSDNGKTTISYDITVAGSQGASGCSVWTDGNFFHADAAAALGQSGEGLTPSGNSPIIPENPAVGMELEDCSVSIESLMLSCDYSKIKFTAHESVTVPAGTFDCWCLEYDTTVKVMGLKAVEHTRQWIAKGIGDVKVISTDKRGRTRSTTELLAVE